MNRMVVLLRSGTGIKGDVIASRSLSPSAGRHNGRPTYLAPGTYLSFGAPTSLDELPLERDEEDLGRHLAEERREDEDRER
jgi:hypothetical protein